MSELSELPDWDSGAKLYSSLFEDGHDFAFLVKSDGTIVEVNERALSFAGTKRNEIVGESLWNTPWFQRKSEYDIKEDIQRACTGETIKTEYRIAGRNRIADVQLAIRPMPETGDDIDFAFVTGVDITRYLEKISKLEEHQQSLEEFVNVVAHDLRNLISLASGHVELAHEEVQSTELEKARTALCRAEERFEHISTTVKQGRQIGERTKLNVAVTAQKAWEAVESPEATLEIESSMTVRADRIRLLEAFENLFRNAVEHAGPDVTVRVGAQEDVFYVADDGLGIDPSEEYIFEPGNSTGTDGMGLGLSIVKSIVTAHGWTIDVTESYDDGAQFEIDTSES